MRPIYKAALLGGGGLLAAWVAWGLYSKQSAASVPYERLESFGGVEIRQYPRTVLAETNARDQMTAFRRLFDYISGSNEPGESVSMTAPVKSTAGTDISMTAPVRSESEPDGTMRMGFYLPQTYDIETAPRPTDADVHIREVSPRSVAALQFSWYAPNRRVRAYEKRLLGALDTSDYDPVGEPYLHRYNDPWTPPFMRENEVAVEVESPANSTDE
ncbi:MAG: SOUL family heme-binding protein [Halodesulfurarchaeum sp.]